MYRRVKYLFTFILCLEAFVSHAQIADTIQEAIKSKPSLTLGINGRFSSVSGEPIRTRRVFVGVDFNKKFKVELGYNYMPKPALENGVYIAVITNRSNQLRFFGVQAEYTFLTKGKWKLSYPIQLGIGQNELYTYQINDNFSRKNMVVPLEMGANAVYYVYDWIGLKGGLGLRFAFGQSFKTYTGPNYNFGVALFPGVLYERYKD